MTDYRIQHQAPGSEGAPLYDLTGNGVYPSDVYDRPDFYLAGHRSDWEAVAKIRASREKPDRRVWIYRAVPKGVLVISPGDWVAITKDYARDHGKARDPADDMPVIAARVMASQIFTIGDIQEWGYEGPPLKGRVVFRPRKPLTPEQKEARNLAARSKRRWEKIRKWRS